jgi:hypothetical protein
VRESEYIVVGDLAKARIARSALDSMYQSDDVQGALIVLDDFIDRLERSLDGIIVV